MSAPHLPRSTSPAVQQVGAAVMVQAGGVRDLCYALRRAIEAATADPKVRRDSVRRLEAFHDVAWRAYEVQNFLAQLGDHPLALSASGRADVRSASIVGKYKTYEHDWIDTTEAAEASGCTQRHCRRLAREVFAPDGRARFTGGSWVIDRSAFDAYMLERNN